MAELTASSANHSSTPAELIVPAWAHGRPGMGQGGWCCGELARLIGEENRTLHTATSEGGDHESSIGTVSVALRAPIPLETRLPVRRVASGSDVAWEVLDPTDPTRVIMRAEAARITPVDTTPVPLGTAAEARRRFDRSGADHVASTCFSCGVADDSMKVWPSPLDDGTGRVATDWTPPPERAEANGRIDPRVVWTALDCTSGFYVGQPDEDGIERHGVTVQYGVTILGEIRAGSTYALVGHPGRYQRRWDGRKRGAGASLFDHHGRLLAYADSFWVALPG